jgi:hypothetical protein
MIPAFAAAAFLADTTRELGADVTGAAAYLEALVAATRGRASSVLHAFGIAIGIQLVLHAPVQMAWLFALDGSAGRAAASAGLRAIPAALGVTLGVLAGGLVLAAASICPAMAAHVFLRDHANVRLHDVVVLALAVPPLLLVLHGGSVAHDVARAALVSLPREPLAALGTAMRAIRPRLLLEGIAYTFAGGVATSIAVGYGTVGGTETKAACAILLAHALLLLRTTIRGAWLARCLDASTCAASSAHVERAPDQSVRPTG